MGSLVHSRECGEATAVSVTSFHPDLVAEVSKCGSGCLNFAVLCTVAKNILLCCRRRNKSGILYVTPWSCLWNESHRMGYPIRAIPWDT